MKRECIRLLCYSSSTVPFAEAVLAVGVKNAWYPGVIFAVNADGTFEVTVVVCVRVAIVSRPIGSYIFVIVSHL